MVVRLAVGGIAGCARAEGGGLEPLDEGFENEGGAARHADGALDRRPHEAPGGVPVEVCLACGCGDGRLADVDLFFERGLEVRDADCG